VLLDVDGHVATVTLNRPEQRNPLSATMLRDLTAALSWCRDEGEIRAVVLTGAGRVFCAGADLSSFDGEMNELQRYQSRELFVDLFILMSELGKPVVGRINGHALAGGFGLACACDILVAVDGATFGTPEINVGIWPMMIQAILVKNVPRKVLLEMEMLGDRWTAAQLHAVGVVNRVVAADQLDATVAEIARSLAKKSPVAQFNSGLKLYDPFALTVWTNRTCPTSCASAASTVIQGSSGVAPDTVAVPAPGKLCRIHVS